MSEVAYLRKVAEEVLKEGVTSRIGRDLNKSARSVTLLSNLMTSQRESKNLVAARYVSPSLSRR